MMKNEKRLINAMTTVTKISKRVQHLLGDPISQHIYDVILQCMAEAPTVDAVVMPCKLGDKVYRIAEGNYHSNYKPFVQELTVTEISWKKEKYGTKDLGFAIIADGIRYRFSSIGKSVFLSKEEAEAKLNGGFKHD